MEFIEKRAKELYESNSGLSKPADQFGFGYPFLSYSDIFHNFYIPDKLTTLVNSTEKDRRSCSIKRGDVFLTRTSETTDELGMSCVALRDIPNATFNGFAKRLRPITDEIVPEYAAYYFRSGYFRAQCMSMASLITRASLNDSMIGRLRIRYPQAKSVQMRIGTILMNYDKLIENNNKRIKLLEQMAENLYKEWFVRFRFPGYENAEFIDGIPKGWKYRKLKDVSDFQYGRMPLQEHIVEEGYPIFTGYRISGYYDSYMYEKPNLIVIARGVGGTGDVRISPPYAFVTNLSIVFLLKEPDLHINYLYQMFAIQNLRYLDSGAAQSQITIDDLKRVKVLIPCDEILHKYNFIYNSIVREIHCLSEENNRLEKQRDLLLPRLMSGKLEV